MDRIRVTEARVVRFVVAETPAGGWNVFGSAGACEHLDGTAFFEVAWA